MKRTIVVILQLLVAVAVLPSANAWQRVTNGLPVAPTITQISADGSLVALGISSSSPPSVYLSTNGGFDFFKAANLPGSSQSPNAVLVLSNKVIVGRPNQSTGGNAIMFTTNNGVTWVGCTGIPNSTTINLLSTDGAGTVFAGAQNNGNVWRSTDGGVSWQQVSTAAASFNGGTIRTLGGGNGREVAAASTGLYLLSGVGTNWLRSTNLSTAQAGVRMTRFGGKTYLINGSVGLRVLSLEDGSTNWTAAGNGLLEGYLNSSTYRDLAASGSALFTSAQLLKPDFSSAGYFFQSTNGGASWDSLQYPQGAPNDPFSLCVVSTNLFMYAGGSGGIAGLFRVQLVDGVPLFPPLITSQPVSVAVHPGANVIFSATVTDDGPLTYQWRKNEVNIPGMTNSTLTLLNVQTNDVGNYTLAAVGKGGTTVSQNANLNVVAKTPGAPQLDFSPGFFANDQGTIGGMMVQGNPNCVATLTNGQVLVGGGFTHVNSSLNPDGFTYTNGFRSPCIALLNSNGTADTNFQSRIGIGDFDSIQCLLPLTNGKILIGGQFTCTTNAASYVNLARVNADGTLDATFVPNDFDNGPQQIRVQSDGKILVQGSFSSVNGVSRPGVARLNSDGSFDSTWPANPQPGSSVFDVEVTSNDEVLIGGSMFTIGGTATRKYVGLLNTNGTVDTAFNHGLNSTVNEVNVQPGGLVWCYGFSTRYTNSLSPLDVTTIPSVIRLWGDGALASVSPTNLSTVNSLYSQQDGKLILVFYDSGLSAYQLMRFNADGSIDNTFNTGTGFDIAVRTMDMSPSGDLYVVGNFSKVNGISIGKFVKLFGASTNVTPEIPVFTVQPKSLIVASGSNAVVRGSALGSGTLSYSWLKDGVIVVGATSNALSFANFSAANGGNYQLVVSNNFGAVTSSIANVNVATPPSIAQQPPATLGSTNGGTLSIPVGVTGSQPLIYQWYINNVKIAGLTNNPLVISNFNNGSVANYYMVASNLFGSATSIVVSVIIGNAPGIQAQPQSQTLNGLGNVSMFATATVGSSTPITYFWYQDGNLVYTRTNNTLTITNAVPPDAGIYRVVLSNTFGMVTSSTATVTIKNPYLAQNPQGVSVVEGGSTNFSANITGTLPIDYYWYRRSFGAGAVTNLLTVSPTLQLNNVTKDDAKYFYYVIASNQWGSVTSSIASLTVQYPPVITNMPVTNLTVEISQTAYAPVLFDAQPTPSFFWYKDGVYQPSLFGAALQFTPAQTNHSGTYQLVLSNFLGSVTSAPIVLTVKPPRGPTITNQPVNVVTGVGKSLSLTVGVDGSPTLQYRWFRDGVAVTGWTTQDSYFVNSAITNDAGSYHVVVTNAYGAATSSVAVATVVVPNPASANGKQFVKIADSTMSAPGLGTNKFNSFRDAFIVNGQVWFGAGITGIPFSGGVYHWSNNVIASLANVSNSIPGGLGKFTEFYGSTYLSDGKVVFAGRGETNQNGIYAWTNGTIIKLYDRNTMMPGRTNTFENFGWPNVIGNQFAFLGFQSYANTNVTDDYRAVCISSNNVLTKLADTNDILPEVGYFRASSSQVAFDGDKVAWWGISDTGSGIYTVSRTAPIASVANTTDLNLASGVNFDDFTSPPDSVPGRTYFVGTDVAFDTSLYYHDTNGVHLIAKPGDSAPGRSVTFNDVGYPGYAATPSGVYFDGLNFTYSGVFYWDGTNSTKIIDSFETLEGLGIQYVYVADANADSLLFYVGFMNGRQALYALMPTGQSFNQWASSYSFPAGQSDPEDDPDTDGLKNVFEFYLGGNPLIASFSNTPTGIVINISGVNYPALTFDRIKNATGVTLLPQVSSTVSFSDSLNFVVHAVVDLGNGMERVTIRSTVSNASQSTQFLRIELSIP